MLFASLEISSLFVLVLVIVETKVHQVVVRFTHFSSVCNEYGTLPESCTNTHNKIKCTEPSNNDPPKCQEQYIVSHNLDPLWSKIETSFSDISGFQLVDDLNCSDQDEFVHIQSVLYLLPKHNASLCSFNIKTSCEGMDVGTCRQNNCTADLTGGQMCEMEDSNVTLSMQNYCRHSGNSCTGYKLPRKPIIGYWKCLGDGTGSNECQNTNTLLECYAVAAQISYTCSNGEMCLVFQLHRFLFVVP